MFGSLDPAKVLVVFAIALVVLGPERLPRAVRQIAITWRQLSAVKNQVVDEVRTSMPDMKMPSIPAFRPGMVSGLLNEFSQPNASTPTGKVTTMSDEVEQEPSTSDPIGEQWHADPDGFALIGHGDFGNGSTTVDGDQFFTQFSEASMN